MESRCPAQLSRLPRQKGVPRSLVATPPPSFLFLLFVLSRFSLSLSLSLSRFLGVRGKIRALSKEENLYKGSSFASTRGYACASLPSVPRIMEIKKGIIVVLTSFLHEFVNYNSFFSLHHEITRNKSLLENKPYHN